MTSTIKHLCDNWIVSMTVNAAIIESNLRNNRYDTEAASIARHIETICRILAAIGKREDDIPC